MTDYRMLFGAVFLVTLLFLCGAAIYGIYCLFHIC